MRMRALLLATVLIATPSVVHAGPAEDIEARATAIQSLLDAGEPFDGEVAAREAARLAEATLGAENMATANINRLLGDTLYSQKRYAEAEPFFRKALDVRDRLLGPDNADVAHSATDLALTLKELERYDEAEPLYRRALDIRLKLFGPDHPDTARSWLRLGRMFDAKGDYAAAASTMANAVAAAERAFGALDPLTLRWTGEWVAELHDSGDLAAAEPVYRRVIPAADQAFGRADLDLASMHQGFANLLLNTGRPEEARPHYRLALSARTQLLGPDAPAVAASAFALAESFEATDDLAEALPYYRQALAIREKTSGPESRATVVATLRVATCLLVLDRAGEAEPLFRKALAAAEKNEVPPGTYVAQLARGLGHALEDLDRDAEAETYMRRALSVGETLNGPDHIQTGYDLLALGNLYSTQRRYAEAETLLGRAVAAMDRLKGAEKSAITARMAIFSMRYFQGRTAEALAMGERILTEIERGQGDDRAEAADFKVLLAHIHLSNGDPAKAGALATQALDVYRAGQGRLRPRLSAEAIIGNVQLAQGGAAAAVKLFADLAERFERQYGAASMENRTPLANLASAEFATGDYESAARHFERSAALTLELARIDAVAAFSSRTGKIEDSAIAYAVVFDLLIKTYFRLGGDRAELSQKAFLAAQRVIESQAASALSQMAMRQAAGSTALAALVRERQDLVDRWRALDARRTLSMDSGPAAAQRASGETETELASIDGRLKTMDERLSAEFPDFADMQQPAPIDFAAVQARLAENEVMLFFADTNRTAGAGFETYLWAIPKVGQPRWLRLDRATDALSADVRQLRALMGVGAQARGAASLKAADKPVRVGAVLEAASRLYQATLAPVADLIEGKALVIVPSQKLSGLPFHLLVSATPPDGSPDRFRDARWVARDHAITVLPSVAALEAQPAAARAADTREPYLGFANPLLTGRSGEDRRAFVRQHCGGEIAEPVLVAAADTPDIATLMRGGTADVVAVRGLEPLPETTDEACAVANALGAGEDALRLGAAATEAEVKRMSGDDRLSHTKILHFATHGLVSGDFAELAEPAIVLTPPDVATAQDDGLLTASEVATLKLDADWVILSACNTAAGDGSGEALSGLARAFFYAGARALMVSHWPVNSDAAVSLATGVIAEIAADPALGRAEALRRSMVTEIAKGGSHADPANWAPFILVGASRRARGDPVGLPIRPDYFRGFLSEPSPFRRPH